MGNATAPERLGYQPALDGLRAVAVLAVLLYHDDTFGPLRGGFLGVDVFFVLSGFLITTILLGDVAHHGTPISRRFWARRIRRLLPAFLLFLVLVAFVVAVFGGETNIVALRRQGLASLLYSLNWYLIGWGHNVSTYVTHTWSLSVEEQWYLVWPFLLAGVVWLARGRRFRLLAIILFLTAVSATLMALLTGPSETRAFFGTDTRAWELLAGAALAVWRMDGWTPSPGARVALEGAGVVALGYVLFALATFHDDDRGLYPGARLLVVAAVVVVIAASIQPAGALVRRVLSLRALVAIGLVSYGVYLFHIPIYGIVTPQRMGFSGFWLFVLRLVAVLAFATLSYRLLEMPIRRGTARLPVAGRYLVPAAVAVVGVVFAVGTAYPGPVDESVLTAAHYQRMAATTPARTDRVLVVGDETAFHLGWDEPGAVDLGGIRGAVASTVGCGISPGIPVIGDTPFPHPTCGKWPDVFGSAVSDFDPKAVVLMLGGSELFDRRVGAQIHRTGTARAADLRAALERVRRLVTPRRELVVLSVPCAQPDATVDPKWAAIRRDPARVAAVNRVFRDFAGAHADQVRFGDLGTVLCPDGNPNPSLGGVPLRSDGVTLSRYGASAVWHWLAPVAESALGTARPTVADPAGSTP